LQKNLKPSTAMSGKLILVFSEGQQIDNDLALKNENDFYNENIGLVLFLVNF